MLHAFFVCFCVLDLAKPPGTRLSPHDPVFGIQTRQTSQALRPFRERVRVTRRSAVLDHPIPLSRPTTSPRTAGVRGV